MKQIRPDQQTQKYTIVNKFDSMNGIIRGIFLADTHLGFDYPIRPRIERRRRGEDFFANFQRVLDYAVKQKADFVIHGGDLFFRSKIPAPIVDRVYQMLLDFSRHDIPIFIVPGNHERSQLPPSLFLQSPGIHIFDLPRTFHLQIKNQSVAIGGFPCVRNGIRDVFARQFEATGLSNSEAAITLLCMHQSVQGAQVGPSNFTFRDGPDVLPVNALPDGCTAILSGHIHRRQVLFSSNGTPVIYPGSVERTAFAEKDEIKGFYELYFSPGAGRWNLSKRKFWRLPSRAMVDVDISHQAEFESAVRFLKTRIREYPSDAIIRLKPSAEIYHEFTAERIREIFPDTLNVQLRNIRKRTNKHIASDL